MYDTEMVATKNDRQGAIVTLVRDKVVRTQAEIIEGLRRKRIAVDQSTLSRDLTELRIRKSGGRYAMAPNRVEKEPRVDYAAAVRSFTTCGPHLTVIHTGTGQAQPVALAIEHERDPAVAGTLAGDDTVFIATKSGRAQTVVLRRLITWFGDKHER